MLAAVSIILLTGKTAHAAVAPAKTIIIGDSRTVCMYDHILTPPQNYKEAIGRTSQDGTLWSCKGAKNYPWMVSTAVPAIEKYIGEGTRVVCWMGYNDIYRNNPALTTAMAEKYITYLNGKAAEWETKGAQTYYVSVTPSSNKAMYLQDLFNDTVQKGFDNRITWIELRSLPYRNFDGTHQDPATSRRYYNAILTFLDEHDTLAKEEKYRAVYSYDDYIAANPDVVKKLGNSHAATVNHFISYGMAEGRSSISGFDVNAYRLMNSDLQKAFGNNLRAYYEHYVKYGCRENRITVLTEDNCSAIYDFEYYLAHNPDVAAVYGGNRNAVFRHFLKYGMKEGRIASGNFNVRIYKAKYSDLRNAFGDDWTQYFRHYLAYGIREHRTAA